MLSSIAAVLLVFGLLGGLLRWTRRWAAKPAPGRALQVIDAIALGNGRSVTVVRSGERYFLLGTTAQAVSLIAELDASNVVAQRQAAGGAGSSDGPARLARRRWFLRGVSL